ncbi:MAG: non-canonical purine NTP pyrophosphatase [Candidatus Babeliales bacterium]
MFKKSKLIIVIFLVLNMGAEDSLQISTTELKMQDSKKTLYYATGNSSKFKTSASFIPQNAQIELKQFACNLFEEQTEDQVEIAVSKAKQAWELLQKPLLVDEVGVYFHKYNNFPGAFTKFVYKGLGFDGVYKLMNDGDELSILLIIVYIYGPDQYKIFTIRKTGFFKKSDREYDKNAPFDLVFVPQGLDKTYIELEEFPEIYNKVYYRAVGMREVLEFISLE